MKIPTFSFLYVCLMLSAIQAQFVTIHFDGHQVSDSGGSAVADGRLVLLLANVGTSDLPGAGFDILAPGSLQKGEFLNSAYQILGRAAVDGSMSVPGDFSGIASLLQLGGAEFPDLTTGDQLAVAWFPTLNFATDFSLVNGTSYGLYTIDNSAAWQVPVAGLPSFTVTVPADQLASLTVSAIPEPSTYAALLGLAVLGLAAYRRRSRTNV